MLRFGSSWTLWRWTFGSPIFFQRWEFVLSFVEWGGRNSIISHISKFMDPKVIRLYSFSFAFITHSWPFHQHRGSTNIVYEAELLSVFFLQDSILSIMFNKIVHDNWIIFQIAENTKKKTYISWWFSNLSLVSQFNLPNSNQINFNFFLYGLYFITFLIIKHIYFLYHVYINHITKINLF